MVNGPILVSHFSTYEGTQRASHKLLIHLPMMQHQKQFGVQHLAQGHFTMVTRARDRNYVSHPPSCLPLFHDTVPRWVLDGFRMFLKLKLQNVKAAVASFNFSVCGHRSIKLGQHMASKFSPKQARLFHAKCNHCMTLACNQMHRAHSNQSICIHPADIFTPSAPCAIEQTLISISKCFWKGSCIEALATAENKCQPLIRVLHSKTCTAPVLQGSPNYRSSSAEWN